MSTHERHEDPEELAKSQAARYELRDGDFRLVSRHVIGFFIFTAICAPISYGIMMVVNNVMVQRPYPINSTRMEPIRPSSSKATLQTNITAHSDMEALRKHEHDQATTFGNSTVNTGKKRIPVDRAIEELGKQGTRGITGGID